MIDTISFSPRLFPASPIRSDLKTALTLPTPRIPLPSPGPTHLALPRVPTEDRANRGMMLGLVAATVPAVVYALLQTWNLASSDALIQAVRAFVP